MEKIKQKLAFLKLPEGAELPKLRLQEPAEEGASSSARAEGSRRSLAEETTHRANKRRKCLHAQNMNIFKTVSLYVNSCEITVKIPTSEVGNLQKKSTETLLVT